MTNEIGGIGLDDLNTWWQVRENTNKVTEEAIRRIQDDQKKAQQIGQQIQDDKKNNAKFAKFLWFLLEEIKSEKLIQHIYKTFFIHTNKDSNDENNHHHIEILTGAFVPFYQQQAQNIGIVDSIEIKRDKVISLTNYVEYIKWLLLTYDKEKRIKKTEFAELITHIAIQYQLTEKLDTEKTLAFENTIQNELYKT